MYSSGPPPGRAPGAPGCSAPAMPVGRAPPAPTGNTPGRGTAAGPPGKAPLPPPGGRAPVAPTSHPATPGTPNRLPPPSATRSSPNTTAPSAPVTPNTPTTRPPNVTSPPPNHPLPTPGNTSNNYGTPVKSTPPPITSAPPSRLATVVVPEQAQPQANTGKSILDLGDSDAYYDPSTESGYFNPPASQSGPPPPVDDSAPPPVKPVYVPPPEEPPPPFDPPPVEDARIPPSAMTPGGFKVHKRVSSAASTSVITAFEDPSASPVQLIQLLLGTQPKDESEPDEADLSKAPQFNACFVGTDSSNKLAMLSKYLGYRCARKPNEGLFRKLIYTESFGAAYTANFFTILDDNMIGVNDQILRSCHLFLLVVNVESRESFDAIKGFYSHILRLKEADSVPVVILLNNTNSAEETWKVSKAEAANLAEVLREQPTSERLDATLLTLIETVLASAMSKAKRDKLAHREDGHRVTEFVVLGDTFVGKSALIKKFSSNEFSTVYTGTFDKNIVEKLVHSKNISDPFLVRLVDTPGFFIEQAIAKVPGVLGQTPTKTAVAAAAELAVDWLRQNSFLGSQAFIIVYSVIDRTSFFFAKELRQALQIARADFKGFQPVLLLANKLDCADGRTVADSEGVEFAQNFDCLLESVSACTSSVEDIDQVVINLIDEIYATDPMAKRPQSLSGIQPLRGSSGDLKPTKSSSKDKLTDDKKEKKDKDRDPVRKKSLFGRR